MAKLERRIRVARHEHALDGDFLRPVGVDDFTQGMQQPFQALREITFAQQYQRRMENVRGLAAGIHIDDAHAGALRTRIDAQDAGHARLIRSLRDLRSRALRAL